MIKTITINNNHRNTIRTANQFNSNKLNLFIQVISHRTKIYRKNNKSKQVKMLINSSFKKIKILTTRICLQIKLQLNIRTLIMKDLNKLNSR